MKGGVLIWLKLNNFLWKDLGPLASYIGLEYEPCLPKGPFQLTENFPRTEKFPKISLLKVETKLTFCGKFSWMKMYNNI
jgi:hypothetical protein